MNPFHGVKRGTYYHNNSVNNVKSDYYKTFHYDLLLVTQTSCFTDTLLSFLIGREKHGQCKSAKY